MSILWIYDSAINPEAGGTERATHLIMNALERRGVKTAGCLTFLQHRPRSVIDQHGQRVEDLYAFLTKRKIRVVINQIGHSQWLLDEFLARGGEQWRLDGGRIITKLHFDPAMFPVQARTLLRHFSNRTASAKLRRIVRVAMLPIERWYRERVLRRAYRSLIEKSDYFVILSEAHRSKLQQMSQTNKPNKIVVIGNPNTFTSPYGPWRIREKSRVALIVSRLDEPQKRLSLALDAWSRVMKSGKCAGWLLRVVGDGEYMEDYRELVRHRKIRNVEFLGRTDPEKHYEEASLYLHTAKSEGWGLTIIEAMQKGAVPIVMDSSPVFSELIRSEIDGILSDGNDVSALSRNIIRIATDDVHRESMAIAALERTKLNDIELVLAKWTSLFEQPARTTQDGSLIR